MSACVRAYSLGYEGLSLNRYIDVLKASNISLVVDVRETPWSYKPGFSKKPLSERLHADGIAYVHLKSAGNPSRNRKMGLPQHDVIELYSKHLDADSSCLEAITDLILNSANGAVCLLCFERDPHACHRKVILDRLAGHMTSFMACHLHGSEIPSEESVISKRIPKSNNRKRLRKQVKISEDQGRLVAL